MTDLWTILYTSIVPVGILVTALAFLIRAEYRSRQNAVDFHSARHDIDKVHAELNAFKEKVASEYATLATIGALEDRIMRQFDRLYEVLRNDRSREA